jgi:hypothetical protein
MILAGKPGDRWAHLRKEAGREESPDTVVFVFYAGTKASSWGTSDQRATRLVTPGGWFIAQFAQARRSSGYG